MLKKLASLSCSLVYLVYLVCLVFG